MTLLKYYLSLFLLGILLPGKLVAQEVRLQEPEGKIYIIHGALDTMYLGSNKKAERIAVSIWKGQDKIAETKADSVGCYRIEFITDSTSMQDSSFLFVAQYENSPGFKKSFSGIDFTEHKTLELNFMWVRERGGCSSSVVYMKYKDYSIEKNPSRDINEMLQTQSFIFGF